MTLFKLVAFSSEEKGADFSEQCSSRISSVLIETRGCDNACVQRF